MPRNKQAEMIEGREPDDFKDRERSNVAVGRKGSEHEDIEAARRPMGRRDASDEVDEIELSEEDILESDLDEEVDLDRVPSNPGPDA